MVIPITGSAIYRKNPQKHAKKTLNHVNYFSPLIKKRITFANN